MGRSEDDAVRRVLDGALDAVIATDGDGGIVGWNRAAEALLGWTKADVVGRKVYDVIIAARHRERFVREMRAVAPEDLRVSYRDCVVVDREGTEIPVDASVAATRVDGCVLITAFVRDIRDRKRTERLREAEHRLARLLAEAPDGRELLVRSQPILATGLGWATIEGWMLVGDELEFLGSRGAQREPAPELAERARSEGGLVHMAGALAAPVVVGGEVLGVTVLRDEPDRVALPDEIATLENISEQLSQYGERRRAEWRRAAENTALASVARASRRLSMATSLAAARQALCDAARQVCGASVAFLAEPDPDSAELIVTAVSGSTPNEAAMPSRLGPGTAVHRVYTSGEPLFVRDARTDPRASNDAAQQAGTVSGLVHPLQRGTTTLGVLGVAWGDLVEATSDHLHLLIGLLADEGSIALSRAEVFSGLVTAASTDPLTGLANLRGWDEALARERARAARTAKPLSVVMLDVDGLKKINDAGGHQAGDRALREAVSAWRSVVRDTDLLARLGGDEFAVALPDCGRDGAQVIGERLRRATPRPQTCSVGAAQWVRGESAESLLRRADRALYAAKQGGRNRTVAAP